jgi:hypothetical protein
MIFRYLTFFVLLCASTVMAQTKLIHHKSHSGSSATFHIALKHGSYGLDNSNFGHAPQRFVPTAQLDSVIFVSDTVAVMVTSEYCGMRNPRSPQNPYLWRAGSDTVINHPLFTLKHDLDSIKKSLKRDYFFKNNIDSIKFIGYDNQKQQNSPDPQQQQQQQNQQQDNRQDMFPIGSQGEDPTSFGDGMLLPLMALLLISLLAGIFSWKFVKP